MKNSAVFPRDVHRKGVVMHFLAVRHHPEWGAESTLAEAEGIARNVVVEREFERNADEVGLTRIALRS